MGDDVAGIPEPEEKPRRGKNAVLFGVAAVALMFFINDVLGWINGGGLFSVIAAVHAVDAHTKMIDVDQAGLCTALITADCLIVISICCLFDFNVDMSKKTPSIFFAASAIIGGGFALDGFFGQPLISYWMGMHGYSRCAILDHSVGQGKGEVWFINYVRTPEDCGFVPPQIVPGARGGNPLAPYPFNPASTLP